MQMQEHPKGFSGETKVSGAGNSNRQEFLSLHKMIGRFNPIQALSCPHHFKVDRQKAARTHCESRGTKSASVACPGIMYHLLS